MAGGGGGWGGGAHARRADLQDHKGEHVVREVGKAAERERAEGRGGGGRQERAEVDPGVEEGEEQREGAAAHEPVELRRPRIAPPEEARGEDGA